MRISECLRDAVTLGGKKVVFVVDYIGEDPTHFASASLLEEATDKHPPVWVNEEDVASVRENHGDGVLVYGIWQVLMANNALDYSSPAVVRFTPYSGLYFNGDGARATTGEYAANLIPSLPGVDVFSIEDLNVDIDNLILPVNQAKLSGEIYEKNYRRIRRSWLMRGASIVGIALTAFGVDLVLAELHQKTLKEMAYSVQQVEQNQKDLLSLKATKIDNYPNQFVALSRYTTIATIDHNFKLKEGYEGDFRADDVSGLIKESHLSNPLVQYFSVSRRNDGYAELKWREGSDEKRAN